MLKKAAALAGCLIAMVLVGCSSWLPRNGPASAETVAAQHKQNGKILFDVVKVDPHVLAAVLARRGPGFALRFRRYGKPPPFKIAIGDTLAVTVWQVGNGLFGGQPEALPGPRQGRHRSDAPPTSSSPPGFGTNPEVNPGTSSEINPETGAGSNPAALLQQLLEGRQPPAPGSGLAGPGEGRTQSRPPGGGGSSTLAPLGGRHRPGTRTAGVAIPDQLVLPDGTIGVPYAGRIPAAGRTPAEVAQAVEKRLKGKVPSPQVVVADRKSAANSVTVNGDIVQGARIPLWSGARLLQVIAKAGGAHAPVRETIVRLSRGTTTATIPLARLVRHPADNIYAWPGDVLTVSRARETFSVFGATGANASLTLDADKVTLAQALGKAHGLRDDLADATGVFLFRYEPDRLVRALGQPLASGVVDGVSPIVYRFDLGDTGSYFLTQRFPMRDKDIIFVADSRLIPLYKWFGVLTHVVGPIERAALVCRNGNC